MFVAVDDAVHPGRGRRSRAHFGHGEATCAAHVQHRASQSMIFYGSLWPMAPHGNFLKDISDIFRIISPGDPKSLWQVVTLRALDFMKIQI